MNTSKSSKPTTQIKENKNDPISIPSDFLTATAKTPYNTPVNSDGISLLQRTFGDNKRRSSSLVERSLFEEQTNEEEEVFHLEEENH